MSAEEKGKKVGKPAASGEKTDDKKEVSDDKNDGETTTNPNADTNASSIPSDAATDTLFIPQELPDGYSNFIEEEDEYDEDEEILCSRDKARVKKERQKENDWTCVLVKLKFGEFYDEYGRISSSGI